MNNILFIQSSLNGEQGNSTKLAQELVTKLSADHAVKLVERDLAKDSLTHLTQQEMGAWSIPEKERNQEQRVLASISDGLVDELKASDTLVLAMPMYNFGVPSTFKAWVDRVARAGVTFKYTDKGPVGLLENKQVIVVAARGGSYVGTEKDSQTQYLKDFFAFLGIQDVRFIYAEGLNMPDGEASFSAAQNKISHFTLSH